MYLKTSIVLAAMVVSFALSSWKLKSPEISMVITAIVGALVAGLGLPVRILVEGLFTNFDLAILFVCASVFINIYSYSGSINIVTRKLVQRVDNKWVLLICMAVFMLIPGALTGAGASRYLWLAVLWLRLFDIWGFRTERPRLSYSSLPFSLPLLHPSIFGP